MKVARTVLRGAGRSDASRLPDQELGGQVRKGEASSLSVYYSQISNTDTNRITGEEQNRAIRFLKAYNVFNGAP